MSLRVKFPFPPNASSFYKRLFLDFSVCLVLVFVTYHPAFAIPPLVAGDVPTADKNHVEWFIGTRYQKTGSIERQVPFTEVVYGISDRQELTFEVPYLSLKGEEGFGDVVLGTKYLFLRETDQLPGIAGSFEWKLENGNEDKGLGSGAYDYDLRLRTQKSWDWFTGIFNLGYTFVGEPTGQDRRDVLFTAFAQEYEVAPKTKLLSEIYWKNSDEKGTPNRFAADTGFKYQLLSHLAIHAAVGKSLREDDIGGPKLRIYAGIKLEFPL